MTRTATVVFAVLLATASASAGGPGVVRSQRVFVDDLGQPLPNDLMIVRIVWLAPSPGDQLVGVIGGPGNPFVLGVTGGTFFDSDHFLAGDRPPPLAALAEPDFDELRYDSWLTIGNTSLDVGPDWPSGAPFADQLIVAPGTAMDIDGLTSWNGGPGGPDNIAWTVPPTQPDPGGGGIVPTPQTLGGNWSDRVVLAQVTIDPGDDDSADLLGQFGLLVVVDGEIIETTGSFNTFLDLCSADLTFDGMVGVEDLLQVIEFWATPSGFYFGDANEDTIVDVLDLVAVIQNWGPCPEPGP